MDNKLSELSKPKAFVVTGGKTYQDRAFMDKSTAERSKADRHDGVVVEPLYSQEYVSALTQRIAELETKLATPVRLSCETHPRCRTQHAKDVRAAGFKVEGDE